MTVIISQVASCRLQHFLLSILFFLPLRVSFLVWLGLSPRYSSSAIGSGELAHVLVLFIRFETCRRCGYGCDSSSGTVNHDFIGVLVQDPNVFHHVCRGVLLQYGCCRADGIVRVGPLVPQNCSLETSPFANFLLLLLLLVIRRRLLLRLLLFGCSHGLQDTGDATFA